MPKALVVRSTGSWYRVLTSEGEYFDCKLKGNFKTKGIKTTNPIAVGDSVYFEDSTKHKVPLIIQIDPRKNYIIRKSTNLSKRSQIIAANIDHAYLIVSLVSPRTSTGFIDRFLSTAEVYHIPASIIFNKIDVYGDALKDEISEMIKTYEKLNYSCYKVSSTKNININQIKDLVKDKISLFSGHSGVGKSTLINALDKSQQLKTGTISKIHQKGKHITTYAEIISLDFGAYIIDTPGIKEFGLYDFSAEELSQSFPEMRLRMQDCKYSNCLHINEPNCAVKEAVEKGEIASFRYKNYLNMIADINKNDYSE